VVALVVFPVVAEVEAVVVEPQAVEEVEAEEAQVVAVAAEASQEEVVVVA